MTRDELLANWRTVPVSWIPGYPRFGPGVPVLYLDVLTGTVPGWWNAQIWIDKQPDYGLPEITVQVINECLRRMRNHYRSALRLRLQLANRSDAVPMLLLTPADLDRDGWTDEVDQLVGLLADRNLRFTE